MMSEQDPLDGHERTHAALKDAREALGDALDATLDEDGLDAFVRLQKRYFRLRYEELAREPFRYRRFHESNDDPYAHVNLQHDYARFMATFTVPDPRNPFTDHQMSIDHCVSPEGEVACEVFGVQLDRLGQRRGSYIG